MEPKYCPFCKSTNIGYSIKTSGSGYHAAYYCKSCHTYGPRVLAAFPSRKSCYNIRCAVEEDKELRNKALVLWNKRGDVDELPD